MNEASQEAKVKLVMVNPITKRPTNLPLSAGIRPILTGQYQNAAEVKADAD